MEFDDLPETPTYALDREASRTELSSKIAIQYRSSACHLFASGTQAIYVVLDSLAKYYGAKHRENQERNMKVEGKVKDGVGAEVVFLFSKHLYRGTLKQTLPELMVRHPQIEFRIINLFEEDLGELSTCQVLFVESCSNPQGLFWDPSNYSRMNPEGHLVVDNTWLSPAIFNPFDYSGANHKIVIDSCTKYISGGTCMLGSACFDPAPTTNPYTAPTTNPDFIKPAALTCVDPIYKMVKTAIRTLGIQVATPSCQIVSEMIDSLDWRLQKSSYRTQVALQLFRQYQSIDHIAYPNVPTLNLPTTSPNPNLNIYPSVVSIHIQTIDFDGMGRAVKLAGFKYMTSFGHPEDSIDTGFLIDATGIWLRISFGYLDDSDLPSKIANLVTLISHQ